MENQYIEYDKTNIRQYDNLKEIKYLDLIKFSNYISEKYKKEITSGISYIYVSDYTKNKNFKSKDEKLFNLNSYLNFNLNIDDEKSEEIKKEIGEFFGFPNENNYKNYYQLISKGTYYYVHYFQTRNSKRNKLCEEIVDNQTVVIKLKINHMERTKENILEAIKTFVKYKKNSLQDKSMIKQMREGCFGKISSKEWNELLKNLEEEQKIIIKRTPKGIIRSIELNDKVKTKEEKILHSFESKGKLKKIGYNQIENTHIYELYKFNLFSHLKTYLILENNQFKIQVEYFSMKYSKNIMQDLGVWQTFKNALNEKIENKINKIEEFLGIKIKTTSLTPLKYINNNSQELFKSKTFEIII